MKTWILALGISLLVLSGLPTLISTPLGTQFFTYIVHKWTGSQLEIKELSIGWFDMQKIEGLSYQAPSFDLKVNRLTSHNSLFEIFFKGGDLGKTLIYSPELTIKGTSQKQASFPLLPYAGDIYVENGSLITPHVTISHLNLEVGIPLNRSLIALKASGQTHSGSFDIKGTVYPHLHENSSLEVHLHNFPLEILDRTLAIALPQYSGVMMAAFGDTVNLTLEANYAKNHLRGTFDLKTPLMSGAFNLKYEEGAISLVQPSTFNWLVKKQVYPYFHLPFEDEVPLQLNFDTFSLPFDGETLHFMALKSKGSITSLPFNLNFMTDPQEDSLLLHLAGGSKFFNLPTTVIEWKGPSFQLKNPTLLTFKNYSGTLQTLTGSLPNFTADFTSLKVSEGELKDLKVSLQGNKLKCTGNDDTGSFSGSFNLKDKQGTLSLNRLSTYNLGTFLGYERDFPSLMGPTLSGKITQKGTAFTLNLKASELSLQGTLYQDQGVTFKGGPLQINWTLSDQSYHALSRLLKKPTHNLIEIKKPSEVKLQVESFDATSFKGNFELKDLTLAPDYHLQNLKGTLDKGEALTFDLTGGLQSGYIKLKGHIDKITEITGEIHNLPTIFLDALPIKIRLSQLFGKDLSIYMKCVLEEDKGTLNLTVDATHFKTDVLASLEKGVLYLNRSIDIGMEITPELGSMLLGDVGIEVVGAKNPLLIHIDSRGFMIPYRSFQMKNMTLPNLSIDLGQILIRPSGSAADVSKIFKLQRDSHKPLHLYFAPLVLHVNQGKATIERTEMLYDGRFDLCTWGEIDLAKEYVNLTLGFTAQALYQGFGLSMPSSYVLTVPLKGPYNNVKIDTQMATTKIAGIIAKKAGASVGGVWGGVLGAVGSLTDDQSKVPPPKHPFPWEKPNR